MKDRTKDKTNVNQFVSAKGANIFQIPLEVFPGFWAYAYLVLVDEYRVLIDVGSGFGKSNEHLDAGLEIVSQISGQRHDLSTLTHVMITHGHIDHFGGLTYVREETSARVGVHELDVHTLTHYEERLIVVARLLDQFLIEAGVSNRRRKDLIELYKMSKLSYHSLPVDFTYQASGMRLGPFEFTHVPGHCPGHVVIRLHDVLFSGDHILEGISPHQSPESLTSYTGLGHFLESLEKVRSWSGEIRLTLGGHNAPIMNLSQRLDEIRDVHEGRLDRILDLLDEPHTISELSRILFGKVHNYNVLLALEEAGSTCTNVVI